MSLHVLIVDDATFIREILKNQIELQGHQVVGEACDGADAVTLAKKIKPDLILMDLVLPKKNGLQAIEEILNENPRIKIVAMSTMDQEFLIKKSLDKGCSSFLMKPFEKKDIVNMLNQISGKNYEKTGAS